MCLQSPETVQENPENLLFISLTSLYLNNSESTNVSVERLRLNQKEELRYSFRAFVH